MPIHTAQPDRPLCKTMSEQQDGRRSIMEWFSEFFSDEPADRLELRETLRDAADRQLVGADELNIIFGALQVSDMQARDIMIPRAQMVVVARENPLRIAIRRVAWRSSSSRIRSKISTFASTAIPTVNTRPARPAISCRNPTISVMTSGARCESGRFH